MNINDFIYCIVILQLNRRLFNMSLLVTQIGRLVADVAVKVAITIATAYLTDVVTRTTSKKRQ